MLRLKDIKKSEIAPPGTYKVRIVKTFSRNGVLTIISQVIEGQYEGYYTITKMEP